MQFGLGQFLALPEQFQTAAALKVTRLAFQAGLRRDELITQIAIEGIARDVTERIASERAATIAKLEPLAAVGQLTALLPVGWWLGQLEHGWQVRMRSGAVHARGATPLDALQAARLEIVQARIVRAAGIGEEVSRDAK